jgi:hypothetical protein
MDAAIVFLTKFMILCVLIALLFTGGLIIAGAFTVMN